MSAKTEMVIFIIAGALFIFGGIFIFLYFYGNITDPGWLPLVLPSYLILFGIGFLFIYLGMKVGVKRIKPFKNLKTKSSLLKFAAIIVIILTLVGSYFSISHVFAPRNLKMRKENIEYDPEIMADYEFDSQFGDLNETVTALMIWNTTLPTDPDTYAWGESYYLYRLVHYFNASGNTNHTLLDYILKRIDTVLENDDYNEDGVPGFGTAKYTEYYIEYPVWDGMIFYPIIYISRVIAESPALNAMYSTNASLYLNKTEQMIQKWDKTNWLEFETGPYGGYGYYLSEPKEKMIYDRGIYNRITALGRVCAELYKATGNATYSDRVTKMGRYFKMALEVNFYTDWAGNEHEMVVWPYKEDLDPYEPQQLVGNYWFRAEDVSHGSIELDFAVECYELGVVFSDADMERFANTFYDFVFKGFSHNPIFSDLMDGKIENKDYFLNIRQGFFKLYPFYRHPELALYINQKSIESLVNAGWLYAVGVKAGLIFLFEHEQL